MTRCHITCDNAIRYIEPTFERPYEVVGSFLFHDAQLSGSDYYLGEARNVLNGGKSVELWGNAHDLTISADHVSLVNRYSDDFPPVLLKLDSFIEVLEYWKEIVNMWDRAGRPTDFTANADFVFPEVDLGQNNGQ